ncbi:MAG: hypothetical protein L0G27_07295, partial [Paracoccus sp. (in: a-proteobacteria)]|nr:hypothetical protein [Paracoccus sp. (in: a-proteobacteria)]
MKSPPIWTTGRSANSVTHAPSPGDCISLRRDVERQVLSRAIQQRPFINQDRTVVVPASSGSQA